jgi:hypothetical protein
MKKIKSTKIILEKKIKEKFIIKRKKTLYGYIIAICSVLKKKTT